MKEKDRQGDVRKTRKKRKVPLRQNIFAQGDNFHSALRSAIANNYPKERKKERRRGRQNGINLIHVYVYTYPFLLLWSSALPALPSGRNALSARPCPGQWLSTDYAVLKRSVGDIMWLRIACNLTCRFIQSGERDTAREVMSNRF